MNTQIENELPQFNAVLKKTDIKYPSRARAYPFAKWAGGKRALIPDIVQVLPESFNDYYEPFLGGGAVFLGLDSRIHKKAVLSDLNAELILTYRMLQKSPQDVIDALEKHQKKHSQKHYSRTRDKGHLERDAVKLAARFIYLNKTCYNGLYRVNKSGKFNVPMGSYKNPNVCDKDNLLAVSEVLENTELKAQSFERIQPSTGDLVYCDPPYDETFTQYTNKGFDSSDQLALRKSCDKWRKSGAHVIVSSSDTEFIRKIWNGYQFTEVKAARNINCKGSERNKVTELLIVGNCV